MGLGSCSFVLGLFLTKCQGSSKCEKAAQARGAEGRLG